MPKIPHQQLDVTIGTRLDPDEIPIRYRPLHRSGTGKSPILPPVPFDPDTCIKYPVFRKEGGVWEGLIEVTILWTPDDRWIRHTVRHLVTYDPSGQPIERDVPSYDEVTEQQAHKKLEDAGFEIPLQQEPPGLMASKEQHRQG